MKGNEKSNIFLKVSAYLRLINFLEHMAWLERKIEIKLEVFMKIDFLPLVKYNL